MVKKSKKTFRVIGDKSTEGWFAYVKDNDTIYDEVWTTNSTPVEPLVVVEDSNGTVFKRGNRLYRTVSG
ncbi:MAG: hypothetical protein ACLTBD_02455 [Clostridia bacterium]